MAHVKGITYGNDAFPKPYEEAHANDTRVFFGSDVAAAHMKPLWGHDYTSSTGCSCHDNGPNDRPNCRSDLNRMKGLLGVELLRLYDWEPRNDHRGFLDSCQNSGIGVLVSVSNYFLKPGGGFPKRDQLIPALIRSFSAGGNYHPAIEGIVFGNELDGYGVKELIQFTQRWAQIEQAQFPGYRKVRLGHPIAFGKVGELPGWHIWDQLLPPLAALKERLFLAPQTYNDADYLFRNAEGKGRGWVDLTYDKYKTPVLFTEIGLDRTKGNHVAVVKAQLAGCLDYNRRNPEKLLAACFFSYTDKVWMQGTSEGSYGVYTHKGPGPCTFTYTAKDLKINDVPNIGTLNVDVLEKTDLFEAVKSVYNP